MNFTRSRSWLKLANPTPWSIIYLTKIFFVSIPFSYVTENA